jgi:hypothetical protein
MTSFECIFVFCSAFLDQKLLPVLAPVAILLPKGVVTEGGDPAPLVFCVNDAATATGRLSAERRGGEARLKAVRANTVGDVEAVLFWAFCGGKSTSVSAAEEGARRLSLSVGDGG